MLEEVFLVPMMIEQYVGEWMTLPIEVKLELGRPEGIDPPIRFVDDPRHF